MLELTTVQPLKPPSSLRRAAPRWHPAPSIRISAALHATGIAAVAAFPETWAIVGIALAGNHLVLAGAAILPRSSLLGPNLVRLPHPSVERREVALTFDDGPDAAITPRVLDMLEAAGAKASFFCVGQRAAAHPHLVREIVRGGHSV